MKDYKTVFAEASDEFCEKRSRFIGTIVPVHSEDDVNVFVSALKKKHHDARHNVYAFVLKDGTYRYSEDGEPQGTAGMPILNVLQKQGLEDCLITVTRYFGGILLGTGGLTRAYTEAASLAVQAAQVVYMKTCKVVDLECDYASYGYVEPLLKAVGRIQDSQFEESIRLKVAIPPEKVEEVQKKLTEFSAGQLNLIEVGEEILPVSEN